MLLKHGGPEALLRDWRIQSRPQLGQDIFDRRTCSSCDDSLPSPTPRDTMEESFLRCHHQLAAAVEIEVSLVHDRSMTPNVRAKRAPTAGRQARAGENVHRATGRGLVACRWRSA
jgi:hypothetical protein